MIMSRSQYQYINSDSLPADQMAMIRVFHCMKSFCSCPGCTLKQTTYVNTWVIYHQSFPVPPLRCRQWTDLRWYEQYYYCHGNATAEVEGSG